MARAERASCANFETGGRLCSAAFAPSRNAAACASGSDCHGLSSGTRRAAVCGARSRGTLTGFTQSRSRRTAPASRRGVQIIRSSSGTWRVGRCSRRCSATTARAWPSHPTACSSANLPVDDFIALDPRDNLQRSPRRRRRNERPRSCFPRPRFLAPSPSPSPEKPLIRRERQSIAPRTLFPATRGRESSSRSRRPGVACRAHENRPDRRTGADTLQTERTRR